MPDGFTPPASVEAEREVLAAGLLEPGLWARVEVALGPGDFYLERHQYMAQAMTALGRAGIPIDPVTLRQALEDSGRLERMGGVRSISELLDRAGTCANVMSYVDIVRAKSLARTLLAETVALEQAVAEAHHIGHDPDELAGSLAQRVGRLGDLVSRVGARPRPARAAMLEQIIREASDPEAEVSTRVVPCGIGPLDAGMGGGLRGGWLVVVLGHSGAGKTAFAIGNVLRHACELGLRAFVVELEMTEPELLTRLLAGKSGVAARAFARRDVQPGQVSSLWGAADEIARWRFEVDERASSMGQVASRARAMARDGGLDLVVIDYLQLMAGDDDDRTQGLERVTRGSKLLAKELDVPVVLLSQVTLQAGRTKGALGAADGRGAQSIQADADIIIVPDNGNRPDGSHVAPTLIAPKFRHGAPIDLGGRVRWHAGEVRFAAQAT